MRKNTHRKAPVRAINRNLKGVFASDSEAELEAPIGAPAFRRWSGEAAEPLLAEKIKLSPVRRSVSDAA